MNSNVTSATAEAQPRETGLLQRMIAGFRRVAWIAIVLADIGLLAWAAMAAFAPERLMGPGSAPILPAGYEGFTGASWDALSTVSARAPEYVTLLFRMYGLYGVAFSLLAIAVAANAFRNGERWAWWALLVGNAITYVGAMAYDQTVRAVGPFELTEYVALALVIGALVVTAGPFQVFRTGRRDVSRRADS
jgi:uncharacterized membrane protein YhaH (DUF805 family)